MDRGFKKERKKQKLTKRKGLSTSSVEKRKEGIGGGVEQREEGEIRRRIGRLRSTLWEEIWVENLPRIQTGKSECAFLPRCLCARACVRLRSTEKRDLYFGTLIS